MSVRCLSASAVVCAALAVLIIGAAVAQPTDNGLTAPSGAPAVDCNQYSDCAKCILADAGCFWNTTLASCVASADIEYLVHIYEGSLVNRSRRHIPAENVTAWLLLQPDAATELEVCPDLQCLMKYVSFSPMTSYAFSLLLGGFFGVSHILALVARPLCRFMVGHFVLTFIVWIMALHFERKAAMQPFFVLHPSLDEKDETSPSVASRSSGSSLSSSSSAISAQSPAPIPRMTYCLDCGVPTFNTSMPNAILPPFCRLCRILAVLDRHIDATRVFLPVLYAFWMIGGTIIAVYTGVLVLLGSFMITVNQIFQERFWTDITFKDWLSSIALIFKRIDLRHSSHQPAGMVDFNAAAAGTLSESSTQLNDKSSVELEEIERSGEPSMSEAESIAMVQRIKSNDIRNALNMRLRDLKAKVPGRHEVLWLFERRGMLQHPWTRTFRGLLGLAVGMIVTGVAVSFTLLADLPAYGTVAIAGTIAVFALVLLASPAVFLTREAMVLTSDGVLFAEKRPFGLAVLVGYIPKSDVLKAYISTRGYGASSIKPIDLVEKSIEHRSSVGFRIAPFLGLDIEDALEVETVKQVLLEEDWGLDIVPDEELAPSSPPQAAFRQFMYAVPLIVAAAFLIGGGTSVTPLARGIMWSSVPALVGLAFAIWCIYSSALVTVWFETEPDAETLARMKRMGIVNL